MLHHIFIFIQQALVNIDRVYRQRVMRISQAKDSQESFFVQHYMLKSPSSLCGAGRNPTLFDSLITEQLELLPGCILNVSSKYLGANSYEFNAVPPTECYLHFYLLRSPSSSCSWF